MAWPTTSPLTRKKFPDSSISQLFFPWRHSRPDGNVCRDSAAVRHTALHWAEITTSPQGTLRVILQGMALVAERKIPQRMPPLNKQMSLMPKTSSLSCCAMQKIPSSRMEDPPCSHASDKETGSRVMFLRTCEKSLCCVKTCLA